MLELREITKDYKVADEKVHALKGISLSFRESEFVSILGPSGCGKTTMLNIIGGLDHYTTGDLVINGVSTKNYHDRDWDTYRNHKIGFVFQSYNLIPHQTISENVELALNISGVPRQERIRRAHEALDKVGLKGLYNKKPNQLSGGQCQRVAIARALVNDPEILLADEPTGALDTVTSKQIMDLIKEISSDCLVIMVTHNPELAEQYSTRIIRLLDGLVTDDSNPYNPDEEEQSPVAEQKPPEVEKSVPEAPKKEKIKKSKLSVWNAFRLSAKNLLSKIKRTVLVCFAGSIGIVGVATVLAVSAGVTGYIENMQNDMLSGNPITISEETLDFTALMESMMGSAAAGPAIKDSVENGKVNIDKLIETLVKSSGAMDTLRVKNNITKDYVKYVLEMPKENYKSISVNYGLDLSNNLYTDFTFTEKDEDGAEGATKQVVKNMSLQSATQTYLGMLAHTEQAAFTSYFTMVNNSFRQSPGGEDFILSQYDIISDPEKSKVATGADEIMIVVSRDTALTDLMLAQYGFYSQDEFLNHCYGAMGLDTYDPELDRNKLDYSELLGKTYTWYPNDVVFTKKADAFSPLNPSFDYSPYSDEEWEGGITLKVSAILRPKEDLSYGSMSSGFYYTSALSEEILAVNLKSEIVKYLSTVLAPLGMETFTSTVSSQGITMDNIPRYAITYYLDGENYTETFYVGKPSEAGAMLQIAGFGGTDTYMLSLRELGGKDIPSSISIYPTNFSYKDNVTDYIEKWNGAGPLTVGGVEIAKEDRPEITYADNLGLAISLINDMIEMVTAALVAFTSLSLVVSTVMIAIITYVSVIERVKEIGVIRSLGGRKRDVSALFIAETFMIGGISGIFGIGITYIFQLILNIIIGTLFGVPNIAALPIWQAFVMIGVSIILTLISGLIPARLAAQKDPVDALRTE
ncbi:MAG: ABC transporter ATP-binding protein/permease [Clostridiales bacterium]|nr:ABC transporter ATP-binding protein/permease [Clostridiales bacterium]